MSTLLSQLKVPVLTVFIALLLFFGLTRLFGPIPFAVNSVTTSKSEPFTVTGEGEATGVPDTAQFSVGVNKQAATVQQAQDQVNTVVNKISDELKKLGIAEKDIQTSNYSVNPNIDFSNGKQTTTGYTVNTTMEIKVKDANLANKALDAATANGANVVNGVSFVLNDDEQTKLEEQARGEAIKNAKEKAESIAAQAGIKLGRIINVTVNPTTQPQPVVEKMSFARAADSSAPTQLQKGSNDVTVTVSLSYETL
jgi:uncharacterized protein YggE